MAATHSYKAVPSILMVAPRGKVKLLILFETPEFSSTAVMVKGKVAPDEEVENAVKIGVAIFFICLKGWAFPSNLVRIGKVIKK